MLKYSFSAREKVLIVGLSIALIVVAWYRFVFMNIQNQITNIDGQIANVQNQLTSYQTRSAKLEQMRKAVKDYQDQGVDPTFMPEYDNTKSLMAYLQSVLGATRYNISFDDPTYSEEDQTVHRSGTVSFETTSYEQARAISQQILRGPYPCQCDAFSIDDATLSAKANGSAQNSAKVSVTLEVTFFETLPEGMQVSAEDGSSSGGQDLTKLTNWNNS